MFPVFRTCLLVILLLGATKGMLFPDFQSDYIGNFRHNHSNKAAFIKTNFHQQARTSSMHDGSKLEGEETDYTNSEEDNEIFWRDITRGDPLALTVWYVTNKYIGSVIKEEEFEECLLEFEDASKAVAPLLVINSINPNKNFLREVVQYGTTEDDLENDRLFYEKCLKVVQDHGSYISAVKRIITDIDERLEQKVFCPFKTRCGCLSVKDVEDYEQEFIRISRYAFFLKLYLFFGNYIDPLIRLFIVISGITMNIVLLLIFAWHKDVRRESNIMVFNIAVNDVLILLVYLPMQYIHHYYPNILPHEYYSNNSLFIAIQTTIISVSAFSVLVMRFQLYFDVCRSLKTSQPRFSISSWWRCALYLLSVWSCALGVAVFAFANNNETNIGHPFAAVLYAVLYIFVLSISMSVLNNLILGRLKQKAAAQEPKHLISSRVIVELSKTFGVTHIPLFIWLLFDGYYGVILKLLHFSSYRHFGIVIYYLNFLYACFNPLALCRANNTYKTLFDKYLFNCM
ncbi:allatostatin-A receptor-like [Periplaneta americana]|uniref:allatostatin-A receptor-like n=1 Tax=Periplaneta americana TaxID=6978 RepID=UPI0037E95449